MANRCPDCNKFVSLNCEEEPEIEEIELTENDDSISFTTSARIVNTCEDCGTEMKEANLDFEGEFDFDFKSYKELTNYSFDKFAVDVDNSDRTDNGGGRYAKRMFGLTIDVALSYDGEPVDEQSITQEIAASYMDDLN